MTVKRVAYHKQVSTNGTNPQSFPYDDYNSKGICHIQLENFAEDDWADTPPFNLKSDDAVDPKTWGLKQLGADQSSTVSAPSTTSPPTAIKTISLASSSSSSSLTSAIVLSVSRPSLTTPFPTSMDPAASSVSSPQPSASKTLNNAAKAGISIGSIFCALALIIAILLLLRIRGLKGKHGQVTKSGLSSIFRSTKLPNNEDVKPETLTEIHGAPFEVDGIGRPTELQGMPRSELHWNPRGIELDATPKR